MNETVYVCYIQIKLKRMFSLSLLINKCYCVLKDGGILTEKHAKDVSHSSYRFTGAKYLS